MIIWSGFGIIVPILIVALGFLMSLFFDDTTLGNASFMAATLLASALPVGFIGFVMDQPGEDGEPAGNHTFFFLKVKWWGAILLAGGIYALVKALM